MPESTPARKVAMTYKITVEPEFVRAELAYRETVEETRDFLRAVVRYSPRYTKIVMQVRQSKPIFHAERHGLIEYFQEVARSPQHRIALLADTADLQASHEYLELLARQRGVNVRSFRGEAEALLWFRDRRRETDRRQSEDRRQDQDRYAGEDRRQASRRAATGN